MTNSIIETDKARKNTFGALQCLWRNPSVGYDQPEVFKMLDRHFGRKMIIRELSLEECREVMKAIPQIYFNKV